MYSGEAVGSAADPAAVVRVAAVAEVGAAVPVAVVVPEVGVGVEVEAEDLAPGALEDLGGLVRLVAPSTVRAELAGAGVAEGSFVQDGQADCLDVRYWLVVAPVDAAAVVATVARYAAAISIELN